MMIDGKGLAIAFLGTLLAIFVIYAVATLVAGWLP
jgi:integral membrane sensor domain MASE1